MITEKIAISNPTGLHTRPAKRFVEEAKKFESNITIVFNDKTANVKSLLKLLKLGISQNNFIELICDGADEQEAMKHLKQFILNLKD
ncbi:MAG: HPr family phosphocarrier protein [Spartobacteria bacterium]|nr:HPr family phosphocarrier protein [Spartobacteria bacterium]